jgi:hypothetical protein
LVERVPETVMTLACRGETVKEPAPKRSRSLWAMPMDIISMAQHVRPNCSGHSEFFRAQVNSLSVLVVIVLGSLYCSLHLFERPFHPGVDEPYGQDRDENDHLDDT